MNAVSERLTRHVRATFPDPDAVIGRLRRIIDPMGREPTERVLAAVVFASHTDQDRVEEMARLAETDWRDVLVVAGLAHEDWPDILDSKLGPE